MPSTEGYPPSLRQSRASSVHASRTAQGVRGLRKATPSAERLCCQREAIHRVWRKARRQAFTRPGQRKVSGKVRQSSACCCNLQRQGYPSTVPLSRQREAIHRACKAGLGVRRPRIQVSAGYLGPWRMQSSSSCCNVQRQGSPSTVQLSRQREAIHRACRSRAGRQASTHPGQRRVSGALANAHCSKRCGTEDRQR